MGKEERQLIDRGTYRHTRRVAGSRPENSTGAWHCATTSIVLLFGGGEKRGVWVGNYPVMREYDLNLPAKSLVRNYRTRNIDIFKIYFNYFNGD